MSDKNKLPDSVSGLDGSVSNEDLEKLNANQATEGKSENPWDKEFDDNLNDEGQPSRVAKNKKRRGIKALVFGLFAALILIMFAPVMRWAIASNSQPNANNGSDQQVVTNDNKEKNTNAAKKKANQKVKLAKQKKAAAAKKAKLKEKKQIKEQELQNQKQKAAEAKLKADKQKEEAAAKAKQNQQNSQSQQSSQNQQNQKVQQDQSSQAQNNQNASGSGYYTVSAGENAYRIALNHNMTTEELYQLNGLQSGSTITPGMQLRVK